MQRNSEVLVSNMSDALKAFKKQYPTITSGDMQSFLLGYQAAIDCMKASEPTKALIDNLNR